MIIIEIVDARGARIATCTLPAHGQIDRVVDRGRRVTVWLRDADHRQSRVARELRRCLRATRSSDPPASRTPVVLDCREVNTYRMGLSDACPMPPGRYFSVVPVEGHKLDSQMCHKTVQLFQNGAVRRTKCLKEAGVDSSKITVVGHGGADPVADNKTPEGRAKNRRVEISILSE